MKKTIMAVLVVLGIACAAVAESTVVVNPTPQSGQSLTVTGQLELIDGTIALKAGGTVYYTPELRRLAGFVPAVQEGATVTVTGTSFPIPGKPGYSHLAVTKLSVSGKDYDLSSCYQGKHGGDRRHR